MKDRQWKQAKKRLVKLFGVYDWALEPASIGPAGGSKRHFRFFGGIDEKLIVANSAEKFWERLDRYAGTLNAEQLRSVKFRLNQYLPKEIA